MDRAPRFRLAVALGSPLGVSVLASFAWYLWGARGGVAALPSAVSFSALTLMLTLFFAWRERARPLIAAVCLAESFLAPLSSAFAERGFVRAEQRVRDDLPFYQELVRRAEIGSAGEAKVRIDSQEVRSLTAQRVRSGQLVVVIIPKPDRRGVIFLSGDDPGQADLPSWFHLRKVAPRWYLFTS